MTKDEARKLPHGLYRIQWKSGGFSEASVGSLYDGSRWFAPTNWTSTAVEGIGSTKWSLIDRIERIA